MEIMRNESDSDTSKNSSLDFRKDSTEITFELTSFMSNGSGILTGNPGAGKSYEINKLIKHLQTKKHVVLFLPIDKLVAETDFDLQNELGLKTNLFEYIDSDERASASEKGFIIIDAFDAARSGDKRNFYIKLIRHIVSRFGEKWNILVVVRIFDAKKSTELLDIFSGRAENIKDFPIKILRRSNEIPCRHVILPELNSDDLTHVLEGHPVLSKYEGGFNPRLKKLLLNPFYISLILRLLQSNEHSIKINSVYSEVQLLDLYWNSRVESRPSGVSYEIFFNMLTNKMLNAHSLSLKLSNFADSDEKYIAFLMSADILTKVGANKNKISYSHNILFDYAISRYSIDDDVDGIIKFISTDKSRIILLKPSIRYFLTKVWHTDKTLFKKICLKLYEAKSSDIPLIAKIMTTQVIVQESDTSEDQDYICSLYEKDNGYREWLHSTIFSWLESVQKEEVSDKPNNKFWLNYFEQIIQNSSNPNDLNIVGWLYKIQKDYTNAEIQIQIGRISRKILSDCLKLRHDNKNYDRFASHLPVILVVKTYGTNVIQSRRVLEKILEIANEEDFDISYLTAIGYNIKEVFRYDLDFVSKFYRHIFSTEEESTKKTELGNAGYMRLLSNRRQDFESIRYHLGQESGALLDLDTPDSLKILISSINRGVCRMHILPYLRDGQTIQDRLIPFNFNKKKSNFLEDSCYIWSDSFFQMHSESEMLSQIKNKIIKLSETPGTATSLMEVLDAYGNSAVVAVLWKDLIKIVSNNPKSFNSILLDLICAKPLQTHSETLNELAGLIEVSLPLFSTDEINQIVTKLIENFEEIDDNDYKKYLLERRNFLLSKIPVEFYPTTELKSEIENYLKENTVPPSKPIEISETKVGFASEEDILELRGIDNSIEENQEILSKISVIKNFNDKWINGKISEAEASTILEPLANLISLVESQDLKFSQQIVKFIWDESARCAKIIARGVRNPESEMYDCSKKVLLKSSTLEISRDKIFTPEYDPLSWSPTPVTDAAEGLLRLYGLHDDNKIWESIEKLSKNENPVVRSIIAIDLVSIFKNNPDNFWKLVDEFIEKEDNYKIHELICVNLSRAYHQNNNCLSKVEERLKAIINKSKKMGIEGPKILNNNCFIVSISHLAFVNEIEWAKTFFDEIIQKKELYSSIKPRIVSIIIDQYFKAPIIFDNKFDSSRTSISKWLYQILQTDLETLRLIFIDKSELSKNDEKRIEDLYDSIDQYITRFFFVIDKKYNKIETSDMIFKAVSLIWNLEKNTINLILDSILKIDSRFSLQGQEMQYLMEMLDSYMNQDPNTVLEQTLKTLKIGHRIRYSSDYLGKSKIQEFVDHFIADHRSILEDKTVMDTFTELLDNYAQGNSPEAIKYIMELDLEYH